MQTSFDEKTISFTDVFSFPFPKQVLHGIFPNFAHLYL